MNAIIDAAFARARVAIVALAMIYAVGSFAYISIPKEANPEVPMPLVYVSTGLDGMNPTDAERLLLEPMEIEFGGIEGLQRMSSEAAEGFASVQLEFTPGGDIEEALAKVREVADRIEGEMPEASSAEKRDAVLPFGPVGSGERTGRPGGTRILS